MLSTSFLCVIWTKQNWWTNQRMWQNCLTEKPLLQNHHSRFDSLWREQIENKFSLIAKTVIVINLHRMRLAHWLTPMDHFTYWTFQSFNPCFSQNNPFNNFCCQWCAVLLQPFFSPWKCGGGTETQPTVYLFLFYLSIWHICLVCSWYFDHHPNVVNQILLKAGIPLVVFFVFVVVAGWWPTTELLFWCCSNRKTTEKKKRKWWLFHAVLKCLCLEQDLLTE